MLSRNKILKAVAVTILVVAVILVLSAPFGFSLANVDIKSSSNVLLAQRDQLYIILPHEIQTAALNEININLQDETGQAIDFKVLSKFPPYEQVDQTKAYDHIILSIEPDAFEGGNYTLILSKNNEIIDKHRIKLRNEFTAPWEY